MINLRQIIQGDPSPVVLSVNVQAAMAQPQPRQSQFEVMVRHFLDRMLNNEAFGEDAATRMNQLAYAIALPGVLVALFLMVAYHHPPPLHLDRGFWQQACDHLFYVTYAFVILGTVMVFQWEMLFPDLLDVYVLTSLPIARSRILFGRLTALGLFLAVVQIETSGLGALFFPAAADLKLGFWHHLAAHAAGVTVAALFATAFFVALQGLLLCLPARVAPRASSAARIASVILLLTILFLFPLVAHSIETLIALPSGPTRWYPPFWFLGVYDSVLYGTAAPAIFRQLAHRGLAVTATLALTGTLLYPIAYRRRVRQLVEGSATRRSPFPLAAPLRRMLHVLVVRTPRARAIFHFSSQTLLRLPRLHLYLAMYAGVGLALVLSGLIVFVAEGDKLRAVLSPDGVRMAVPVLAFWSVMGLRTALRSPLGLQGSWVFRVIGGRPEGEQLRAAELLAGLLATALTLAAAIVLHLAGPAELRTPLITTGQVVVAFGLCILLTDLAFHRTRAIPFTTVPTRSTRELPVTLVLYFMAFPAFALTVVEKETWIEASWFHLLKTALAFAAAHAILRLARARVLRSEPPLDDLLFVGLGLRED